MPILYPYRFSHSTELRLARAVGFRCSNPECPDAPAPGATLLEDRIRRGRAVHIHSPLPGGLRHEPRLRPDELVSADNGLWLCTSCAERLEARAAMQTVAQLRQWREQSAATTYRQVAEGANETAPSARSKRETFCAAERLRRAAAAALQARTALDTVERGDSITCDFRLPDGMPLTSEALAAGLDVNPELLLKARGEGTSAAALHALLRAIRDRGVAPLLVPLGIWEHGTEGLVRVALDRSGAKASRRELLALAEAGELALVLDAWSGLQPDGRARAAAQIAALRRLYPLLRLVVITTSDRDPPPIAGVCVTALPASASRT